MCDKGGRWWLAAQKSRGNQEEVEKLLQSGEEKHLMSELLLQGQQGSLIEINKDQQHILPRDQHKRKLPSGRKTVHKEI